VRETQDSCLPVSVEWYVNVLLYLIRKCLEIFFKLLLDLVGIKLVMHGNCTTEHLLTAIADSPKLLTILSVRSKTPHTDSSTGRGIYLD